MSNKEKSSAATSGRSALVPKLRFPEFQDAGQWQIKPFEKLFTLGNGRDHKHLSPGNVPVYGSGGFMRLVDDHLYEGESVCIGRKGTIDNPIFLTGKFWTVDTLFYTHSFKHCLPKFIFAIFQQIDWRKHNEAGGVPSLSKANIEKIEVATPSLPEQKKIADCLDSADALIAAQGRKVDALRAHKKGLMQQLFPQEGETQPRLRFPEFEGEWKEEKIDDLFHFQDGFAFSSNDFVEANADATQVIRITDINNKNSNQDKVYVSNAFLASNKLDKYFVKTGDLLLSLTGAAGFNFFFWNGDRALINQRTAKVSPTRKSHSATARLLEPMVHKKINARGEGQNNNLTKEFLSSVLLRLPSVPEQQRIADCFTSLDDLIAAETRKLDTLKTHKKGLMQQLFPRVGEADS